MKFMIVHDRFLLYRIQKFAMRKPISVELKFPFKKHQKIGLKVDCNPFFHSTKN